MLGACVLVVPFFVVLTFQNKSILKEKRNATGGNIILVWLDDGLMNSFLEMSN